MKYKLFISAAGRGTRVAGLTSINKSLLPQVKENSYHFGTTKLFGGNITIGGMAGDQQAATIGQACFRTGQSKSTYGTGCFMLMNIGEKFKLSNNKLLTTVAFKINGKSPIMVNKKNCTTFRHAT